MVASSTTRSPFLDLPLEIREQVYGGLLCDSSGVEVQMLRTSQQIYAEAQPFLFKRPSTFASQFDFYDWVQGSSAHNRKYVQCVRLKLVDVISREGLPASSIQEYRRNSPSPIVLSYEADLARFATALKGVPNLRSMTLYKNRTGDSDHFRDFHRQCFAVLAKQFPGLRSLAFYVDQVPVDFLASFRSLSSLRFTGFSTSPPQETLKALQKLTKLDELELFGPPPAISFNQRRGYTGPRATQSMTAEVMAGLNPLRSITICEIRDQTAHPAEVFVSKSMLMAIGRTHGSFLRRLRISTDFTPSVDSWIALCHLLSSTYSSSCLQEIELGWPGLDGKIIDALPSSLRSLQITVGPSLRPDDLVDRLLAGPCRARLSALVDVVVRMDWRDVDASDLVNDVESAIARLQAVGLRASRGSWYPIILDSLD